VAGDNYLDVVTSGDPNGGAAAWSVAEVNGINAPGAASCPTDSFCAVGDSKGKIVTSASPAGDGSAWHAAEVDLSTHPILAISCPTPSFCAATDEFGAVMTSPNPSGGTGAWNHADIDGTQRLGDISCPSVTFCAAVDSAGNVLTSTNPGGGPAAWAKTTVDPGSNFVSISCPSIELCVAGDVDSDLAISTDPTGGTASWTEIPVGGANAISCPSSTFCAAIDHFGHVLLSTDPGGGQAAWTVTDLNAPLSDISCPTATLCIAVNFAGETVTSSNPTAGAAAWTRLDLDGDFTVRTVFGLRAVSCPSAVFCLAVGEPGYAVTGVPAAEHGLDLSMDGDGTGQVFGDGISCPGDCADAFADETKVTLQATEEPGSIFAGWSGACSGRALCHLIVDSDKSVIATFTAIRYRLNVIVHGSGRGVVKGPGIHCPGDCSQRYREGTDVTLRKSPAPGSRFAGWSGAPCGRDGRCRVQIVADQSIGADFELGPPDTVITGFSIEKDEHRAVISFQSSDGPAAKSNYFFRCSLALAGENVHPRTCRSPIAYNHLAPGRYTFKVRAFAPSGKDPTPATKTFRIRRWPHHGGAARNRGS
jgi:hypothetical protein